MEIRTLPSAESDLRDGYWFYEKQESGLGDYFFDALSADIDSIQLYAGTHPRKGNLFRFQSKIFPYWIYYRLDESTAYVVAILDARQDPASIAKREEIEDA